MAALFELLAQALVSLGRGPRWLVALLLCGFGACVIIAVAYGVVALGR